MEAPSPVGISSALDHSTAGLKKTSIKTTRSRCNINPFNGATFSPASTIRFNLPRRGFLSGQQSYLKFSVNLTFDASASAVRVDHSAQSFINKLEVFHNGALIESIVNYNSLACALSDIMFTPDGTQGIQGSYMGMETIDATGALAADTRRGRYLTGTASTAKTFTFCIPILSSIFALSDKYFPLGLLSQDLEFQFTLAGSTEPIRAPASVSWTVSDAYIIAEVIEVSDMASVRALYPETITIPSVSYRTYTDSISASSGNVTTHSTQIPFKGSSAKALLVSLRDKSSTGISDYNVSSRVHGFSSLQLKLGGLTYPSSPVTATSTEVAEVLAELAKTYHGFNATNAVNGLMSSNMYKTGTGSSGTDSWQNAGLYGLDLESFSNKGDVLISGVNMSNITTILDTTAFSDTPLSLIEFFVMHDLLLYITPNGQLMSRF